MSICYSAPLRFLLRGAPDYSADTESEFHAEAHEQLRVKDLSRVPTRRFGVDSNPKPSGCKAPNIPLHHRLCREDTGVTKGPKIVRRRPSKTASHEGTDLELDALADGEPVKESRIK